MAVPGAREAPQRWGRCPRCGTVGVVLGGPCPVCDLQWRADTLPKDPRLYERLRERRLVLGFLVFVAAVVAVTLFAVHPIAFVLMLLPTAWLLLQVRSTIAQMDHHRDAVAPRAGARPRR